MAFLDSIKPFWPLILTFILPRALGYYHALKAAVRTRPPPRALPADASRGLNILFGAICGFLVSSFPLFRAKLEDQNVFVLTKSRFLASTDAILAALTRLRPAGMSMESDEALRKAFSTPALRTLYLRFGPRTLMNCQFCHPDDPLSYFLYHLPTNILFPHLFHIFVLGVTTSEPISGFHARQWRRPFLFGAIALLSFDIFQTHADLFSSIGLIQTNPISPAGVFWLTRTTRLLSLCGFDLLLAMIIYASSTGRFPWLLFLLNSGHPDVVGITTSDPETIRRRNEQVVNQTNIALQTAQTKLRAYTVTRNAVVRDNLLKNTDDEYWRTVVAMEELLPYHPSGPSVWDDEEVQAAMARAYGNGSIDVARMRREADVFVDGITRGLENVQ